MVKMFVEWMKAANDDLILLNDIKNNEQITNLTAFHSQQAVEKTLKAVLEYRREEKRYLRCIKYNHWWIRWEWI